MLIKVFNKKLNQLLLLHLLHIVLIAIEGYNKKLLIIFF